MARPISSAVIKELEIDESSFWATVIKILVWIMVATIAVLIIREIWW